MDFDVWVKGIFSYGVIGLVAVGFLLGYIVPKSTHQREIDRADKAQALAEQLSDLLDRLARGLHP